MLYFLHIILIGSLSNSSRSAEPAKFFDSHGMQACVEQLVRHLRGVDLQLKRSESLLAFQDFDAFRSDSWQLLPWGRNKELEHDLWYTGAKFLWDIFRDQNREVATHIGSHLDQMMMIVMLHHTRHTTTGWYRVPFAFLSPEFQSSQVGQMARSTSQAQYFRYSPYPITIYGEVIVSERLLANSAVVASIQLNEPQSLHLAVSNAALALEHATALPGELLPQRLVARARLFTARPESFVATLLTWGRMYEKYLELFKEQDPKIQEARLKQVSARGAPQAKNLRFAEEIALIPIHKEPDPFESPERIRLAKNLWLEGLDPMDFISLSEAEIQLLNLFKKDHPVRPIER